MASETEIARLIKEIVTLTGKKKLQSEINKRNKKESKKGNPEEAEDRLKREIKFAREAIEYLVQRKADDYAAQEIYLTYDPTKYNRRYDLATKRNFEVTVYYIANKNSYHIEFHDYTPPNTPFKRELYGSPSLAEWLSAVEWDPDTGTYTYLSQGIIKNIWSTTNSREAGTASSIWASPNFRPYLRKVQEYIQNGELLRDLKIYKAFHFKG